MNSYVEKRSKMTKCCFMSAWRGRIRVRKEDSVPMHFLRGKTYKRRFLKLSFSSFTQEKTSNESLIIRLWFHSFLEKDISCCMRLKPSLSFCTFSIQLQWFFPFFLDLVYRYLWRCKSQRLFSHSLWGQLESKVRKTTTPIIILLRTGWSLSFSVYKW